MDLHEDSQIVKGRRQETIQADVQVRGVGEDGNKESGCPHYRGREYTPGRGASFHGSGELRLEAHFFQYLVEAGIRYLPLYPDHAGVVFNEKLLNSSPNIFCGLVQEYNYLEDTIKVIDVISSTGGSILKLFMNAEIDEAIGMFAAQSTEKSSEKEYKEVSEYRPSDYWRWRMKMAEKIASELDADRFGVKGIYVFGSTKNAVSGPGSDIDLIVHIEKEKCNMKELSLWFEGWSLALSEMNYLRTGYRSSGLLDIHYVTDEDIKNKSSYASKIGAVTDAARPLKVKAKAN